MAWKVQRRCGRLQPLSYEGSKEVKRNKLTFLRNQYEMFTMEDNENVQSMITRLQTIINSLRSLGTKYEINDKKI